MSHENSPLPLPTSGGYAPVLNLVYVRLLDFIREPEAVFWVCVFPVLMVLGLGVAFRSKPVEKPSIDIVSDVAGAEATHAALVKSQRFNVHYHPREMCLKRLRGAKTDLVIETLPGDRPSYQFRLDGTRPESVLARASVDDELQRQAGRIDPAMTKIVAMDEKGSRYVDFLVPGLMGMSLMGGGMWGVGFVTVDMRIRKLLKRFLATPMRKDQFLAGILLARIVFLVPENVVLLVIAYCVFGVTIQGNPLLLMLVVLLGAAAFAGIGLLVASRAKTVEAVSGLMNLIILPMWIFSGVFFSSERFPAAVQPLIRLLPLTALNDALRGIMQDGQSAYALLPQLALLMFYAVASFFAALKWFRWN